MKRTMQTGLGLVSRAGMKKAGHGAMRQTFEAGGTWRQTLLKLFLVSVAAWGLPAHTLAAGFEPREAVVMTDSMMADGRLSLTQFEWQGSVEGRLQALEKAWSMADVPPMRSSRDDWQVITRLDGEVIESIELRQRAEGHVEGRRIRWKHDEKAVQALRDDERWFRALLPPRTTIKPPIRHEDGGRLNSTLVAASDSPLRRLDTWIDRQLQRQGYQKFALDLERSVDETADEVAADAGRSASGASTLSGPLTRSSSEKGSKASAEVGTRASVGAGTRSAKRLKLSRQRVGRAVFYAKGVEEIFLTVMRQPDGQTVVLHWRR